MIVQHGYGGDKQSFVTLFAPGSTALGYAVIGIDAQYHGERKVEGKDIFSTDLESDRAALIQTVVDLRRTVDYLESRKDIDKTHIIYAGASMGGILGSIFGGVEHRPKAFCLMVGGGNWKELISSSDILASMPLKSKVAEMGAEAEKMFQDIEPLNFIGHMAPRPLLMLNGKQDTTVPPKCSQQLFDAAKEPKKIVWFDAGHSLADPKVIPVLGGWMQEQIGKAPVQENPPKP